MERKSVLPILLMMIGAFGAPVKVRNETTPIAMLSCGYYQRGFDNASILDCRTSSNLLDYIHSGYIVRRKIFVPVGGAAAWQGQPVWTMSPPLTDKEAINSLPVDAFLTKGADEVDALSLRRLNQQDGLDLTALYKLTRLSRLELAETNATCLHRNLFVAPTETAGSSDYNFAVRLFSLRLTENANLICIQDGALDPLVSLTELSIRGSPRLKSIGGAAVLPVLSRLELLTGANDTEERLAASADNALCQVSASLRHLTINSNLALMWKPTLSLENISSIRVEPPNNEAAEVIVQTIVLRHQAALCAVWPTGQLQFNGLLLADLVADQLAMDYAEGFCGYVSKDVLEYTELARLRCDIVNVSSISVCDEACQLPVPSLPVPKSTLLPATLDNPTIESTITDSAQNRRDDTPDRQETNTAEDAMPGLDRQGVIGTALLTGGAFMGGALIAAYCCHSRRRMAAAARLKLAGAATITGSAISSTHLPCSKNSAIVNGSATTASKTAIERGEMEPIRLIGYTAGLGDTGSRVVVFKEVDHNGAAKSLVKSKIVDDVEEADGDTLLTAQL